MYFLATPQSAEGYVDLLLCLQMEMVRVFICTTTLHIRLTKMKFELVTTPFLQQFDEAVESRSQLSVEVERMTKFIQPAVEAVENPDPHSTPNNSSKVTEPRDPDNVTAIDYAENYRQKLQVQCLYQIKETQRVCWQNYSYLYLDCVERVTLIQSVCNNLKVENYCSTSKVRKCLRRVVTKYTKGTICPLNFFVDCLWFDARIVLRPSGCHSRGDG